VEAALARGHQVTIFNRGKQNPSLFPEVEKLRGDRNSDVAALQGKRFDSVIDTSTYNPEQAHRLLEALDQRIEHYLFVSSISAYASFPPGRSYDETAPLAKGNAGYGPLKARSEEALEAAFPGRVAHIRPGLIAGPHDPTDRFTYWPRRIGRGGVVLAPGRPEQPVQFIDVRDLAAWCVLMSEDRRAGAFNAVGPRTALTMQDLLKECRRVTKSDARLCWISDEELCAAHVQPWTELPLWIPENDQGSGGHALGDNTRAIDAGLAFLPLADTVRATFEWDSQSGGAPDSPLRVHALSAEKENGLLARRRRTTEGVS
jgi:2'-hydroxyisoflavone reductase